MREASTAWFSTWPKPSHILGTGTLCTEKGSIWLKCQHYSSLISVNATEFVTGGWLAMAYLRRDASFSMSGVCAP